MERTPRTAGEAGDVRRGVHAANNLKVASLNGGIVASCYGVGRNAEGNPVSVLVGASGCGIARATAVDDEFAAPGEAQPGPGIRVEHCTGQVAGDGLNAGDGSAGGRPALTAAQDVHKKCPHGVGYNDLD